MARPIKCRRISSMPCTTYFKPAGIPVRELEEVRISLEELEAIRLKDLEDMEQEQGAECMQVSRPTFQRILSSARQKIADALLNGKALKIDGGNIEIAPQRYICALGHEWSVSYEASLSEPPEHCPACETSEIFAVDVARKFCRRTGKPKCCERKYPVTDNNPQILRGKDKEL